MAPVFSKLSSFSLPLLWQGQRQHDVEALRLMMESKSETDSDPFYFISKTSFGKLGLSHDDEGGVDDSDVCKILEDNPWSKGTDLLSLISERANSYRSPDNALTLDAKVIKVTKREDVKQIVKKEGKEHVTNGQFYLFPKATHGTDSGMDQQKTPKKVLDDTLEAIMQDAELRGGRKLTRNRVWDIRKAFPDFLESYASLVNKPLKELHEPGATILVLDSVIRLGPDSSASNFHSDWQENDPLKFFFCAANYGAFTNLCFEIATKCIEFNEKGWSSFPHLQMLRNQKDASMRLALNVYAKRYRRAVYSTLYRRSSPYCDEGMTDIDFLRAILEKLTIWNGWYTHHKYTDVGLTFLTGDAAKPREDHESTDCGLLKTELDLKTGKNATWHVPRQEDLKKNFLLFKSNHHHGVVGYKNGTEFERLSSDTCFGVVTSEMKKEFQANAQKMEGFLQNVLEAYLVVDRFLDEFAGHPLLKSYQETKNDKAAKWIIKQMQDLLAKKWKATGDTYLRSEAQLSGNSEWSMLLKKDDVVTSIWQVPEEIHLKEDGVEVTRMKVSFESGGSQKEGWVTKEVFYTNTNERKPYFTPSTTQKIFAKCNKIPGFRLAPGKFWEKIMKNELDENKLKHLFDEEIANIVYKEDKLFENVEEWIEFVKNVLTIFKKKEEFVKAYEKREQTDENQFQFQFQFQLNQQQLQFQPNPQNQQSQTLNKIIRRIRENQWR